VLDRAPPADMANQSARTRSPLSFSALSTIKAQIRANGSSSNLLALLASDDDDAVLVEVREQKLLLGYTDWQELMQCLDAFKRRAKRTSGAQEFQEHEAYADFVDRITELRTTAATKARDVIARMPRLGTAELAELTGEYATAWLQQIADTIWAGFTDDLGSRSLSDATRAAVSERAVHEVKGSLTQHWSPFAKIREFAKQWGEAGTRSFAHREGPRHGVTLCGLRCESDLALCSSRCRLRRTWSLLVFKD
jgi:hypothetical protein